jgi:hypothetical protein
LAHAHTMAGLRPGYAEGIATRPRDMDKAALVDLLHEINAKSPPKPELVVKLGKMIAAEPVLRRQGRRQPLRQGGVRLLRPGQARANLSARLRRRRPVPRGAAAGVPAQAPRGLARQPEMVRERDAMKIPPAVHLLLAATVCREFASRPHWHDNPNVQRGESSCASHLKGSAHKPDRDGTSRANDDGYVEGLEKALGL